LKLYGSDALPKVDEAHYNIDHFYPGVNADKRTAFRGETLRVGDHVPSFRLPTVDGDFVVLENALSESHVALIFGSYSAPPCVAETPDIDKVFRMFSPKTVNILFVYTREIHPNEPLPPANKLLSPHRTMAQKVAQAKAFRDDLEITMPVCVDDLAGTLHLSFGGLPFSAAVIHQNGVLIHRSEWADADLLRALFLNIERAERMAEGGRSPRLRTTSYCETMWF
jgi:hypothetical protein